MKEKLRPRDREVLLQSPRESSKGWMEGSVEGVTDSSHGWTSSGQRGGLTISVAPCKPYLLLLFFFLPLVFPSLHKYLVSTYYVQALVLGSMPFKINKAGTSPSQLSGKTDIKQDAT